MRVVITKSQLEEVRACSDFLRSPEWNGKELVYENWEQTVDRLFSTRLGVAQLNWLVDRKLVPMTMDEFNAQRQARPAPTKGR